MLIVAYALWGALMLAFLTIIFATAPNLARHIGFGRALLVDGFLICALAFLSVELFI